MGLTLYSNVCTTFLHRQITVNTTLKFDVRYSGFLIVSCMQFKQQMMRGCSHYMLFELLSIRLICHVQKKPITIIKLVSKTLENGEKRSGGETYLTTIYGTQQRVPRQWKKFLSAGRNKEELLKFLFEEWQRSGPEVLNGVEVLITHEN